MLALTAKSYPYLNLGCGGRFDARWTNIDFQSSNPVVIRHDLTKGIPFGDGAFSVVYHSHLLEHLSREQGRHLLKECLRVLEPGGVLRVVVPDLESATRAYLDALTRARLSSAAHADHKWMVIELIDQLTRTEPGGRMRAFLRDPSIPNQDFVIGRIGGQAASEIRRAKSGQTTGRKLNIWLTRLRTKRGYARYAAGRAVRAGMDLCRRAIFGPRDWEAVKAGRFRLRSGEVHQWMYDDLSLWQLLAECGFEEAQVQTPSDSLIEGWDQFHLDADPDGSVWLPNSLYMEARKP